jgi:hypothetical protein
MALMAARNMRQQCINGVAYQWHGNGGIMAWRNQ